MNHRIFTESTSISLLGGIIPQATNAVINIDHLPQAGAQSLGQSAFARLGELFHPGVTPRKGGAS